MIIKLMVIRNYNNNNKYNYKNRNNNFNINNACFHVLLHLENTAVG